MCFQLPPTEVQSHLLPTFSRGALHGSIPDIFDGIFRKQQRGSPKSGWSLVRLLCDAKRGSDTTERINPRQFKKLTLRIFVLIKKFWKPVGNFRGYFSFDVLSPSTIF